MKLKLFKKSYGLLGILFNIVLLVLIVNGVGAQLQTHAIMNKYVFLYLMMALFFIIAYFTKDRRNIENKALYKYENLNAHEEELYKTQYGYANIFGVSGLILFLQNNLQYYFG